MQVPPAEPMPSIWVPVVLGIASAGLTKERKSPSLSSNQLGTSWIHGGGHGDSKLPFVTTIAALDTEVSDDIARSTGECGDVLFQFSLHDFDFFGFGFRHPEELSSMDRFGKPGSAI